MFRRCIYFVAVLCLGIGTLSAATLLPLTNPGFEDGPLYGCPTGWLCYGRVLEPGDPDYWSGPFVTNQLPYQAGNRYAAFLPGAGYIPEGDTRTGRLTQQVAMPVGSDVRWVFWESIAGSCWSAGQFCSILGPNFAASVTHESVGPAAFVVHSNFASPDDVSGGWTETAVMGGKTVVSPNLADWFAPGDELIVSFSAGLLAFPGSPIGTWGRVDDSPPAPEPATLGLLSVGIGALLALKKRRD